MLRTHTCGDLRMEHATQEVVLSGWVQRVRNKGGLVWVDVRDRYGITQLVFEDGKSNEAVMEKASKLGREFVIQAKGTVAERYSKNDKMPTGDIEVWVSELNILNKSEVPPFMIEDDTDGGEDLRAKFRYLDLRRNPVRASLELRHKMGRETRKFLDALQFIEVETPVLIKSTPEGARDFVVPSRMNPGEFYALPQSPQTFKQLLMVGGFDRYYQIVKCFRDEDLRADRQPEFTQIDCEMTFVEREDILQTFEGLLKHLLKEVRGVEITEDFPRMSYADAMEFYGNDKPDIRFDMKLANLNEVAKGKDFAIFDSAELVVGIAATGCADYTRKQIDALTDWVKRPQIGMKGMVYVKCNADGSFKSSVDKFYNQDNLKAWAEKCGAKAGDLMLVLSGDDTLTRKAMSELRLEMGKQLGLRKSDEYQPLWVLDFPLLEKDEESGRWHAMHHPFTSPHLEDLDKLAKGDFEGLRANAYDLVLNGVEIGGGSIRIHDRSLQSKMFDALGFTPEEAKAQFGFLMNAFEYGAPPHGGIAFGFDRLCSLFGGVESIRDFIAFPKNTSGRDVMIDAPSPIANDQLDELGIKLKEEKK